MTNGDTKVIRGNWGKVWINGEMVSGLKNFNSKVTAQYEDVDVMGKPGKYRRFMGYEITGSFVLHKINNRVMALLAESWQNFTNPVISLLVENDDPDVGTTRIRFSDVSFDDFSPLDFENKTLTEETVNFAAGSYQVIDGQNI